MPAGNMQLAIQITAEGRVDQVVRQINEQMKPLGQVLKPMSAQFRDNERHLGQSSQHLHEMRESVTDIARKFTEIAPPLGPIAALGSLAGIGEMLDHTSRLGRELSITSANLGISTEALQGFRGGAELAGVSAQGMTNALGGLQGKLYGAAWGRDAQAIAVFKQFQIEVRAANGDIRSMKDVLPQVADAIAKQKDPFVQATMAMAMGVADILPYLRLGSKGMEDYNREIAYFGGVTSPQALAASEELQRAQTRLGWAVHGVADELLVSWGLAVAHAETQAAVWLKQLKESPAAMDAVGVAGVALSGIIGLTMVSAVAKLTARVLAFNAIWLASPLGRAIAILGALDTMGLVTLPIPVKRTPAEQKKYQDEKDAETARIGREHGPGWGQQTINRAWDWLGLPHAKEAPVAPPSAIPQPAPMAPQSAITPAPMAPQSAITPAPPTPEVATIGGMVDWMGRHLGISGAQAAPMPMAPQSAITPAPVSPANWQQGPAWSPKVEAPNDRLNNWASMRARGGGWQSFETPEAGVRAVRDQLGRYASGATTGKQLDTLQDIIGTWAPPGENQTETLIARAERQLSIGRRQHLDLGNGETMRRLVSVMIANEHGGVLPKGAPQTMIDKALAAGPSWHERMAAALNPISSASAAETGGLHAAAAAGKFSAGRVNLGAIEPALVEALSAATARLPEGVRAVATSGERIGGLGGSRHHADAGGRAEAMDLQLIGPNGAIANRGEDTTGLYGQLARNFREELMKRHPEMSGKAAWGGNFETSPGSRVKDLMHYDIGGDRGRYGSLEEQSRRATLDPSASTIAGRYRPNPLPSPLAPPIDQSVQYRSGLLPSPVAPPIEQSVQYRSGLLPSPVAPPIEQSVQYRSGQLPSPAAPPIDQSGRHPLEIAVPPAVPPQAASPVDRIGRYRPEIAVPPPVADQSAAAAPQIDTSGIAAAAQSRHEVMVEFGNAPSGMRANVRAANGPADFELRTQYAMASGF